MAEKRVETMKDMPTFKERGFNVICGTYRGIAVPPQTPDDIAKVLEDAIALPSTSEIHRVHEQILPRHRLPQCGRLQGAR